LVDGLLCKPKSRRGHVAFVAVVASSAAFASSVAGGCLPDLGAIPAWAPPSDDGAILTTPRSLSCGDGIIDTLDDGGDAGESCDPGEASVAGCEDCRFVCSGAISEAGHCYFFADPTESYGKAVGACQGANAHVVTYASADEAAFVEALVASSGHTDAGPHWVGLLDRADLGGYAPPPGVLEPGWPSAGGSPCPGCFALGVDDAGAFGLSSDAEASGQNGCLVEQDGGWARAACSGTEPRTTVCEREPIGQRIYPCNGVLCATIPITLGQKRYVLSPAPAVADEARRLCETTYADGGLVMFESREEREQLVREIAARLPPPVELWIGLAFDDDAGAWTWDDGKLLGSGSGPRPLPWGEDQPVSSTGRAFLRVVTDRFDTELAGTDPDLKSTRVFACQRPE
jgi:hypothetical protein